MTRTLFRGGCVFDGTGAPPARGDVVVEDGTIVDVGAGLDGDEEVDLEGRTLLPGLFDCHVHFTMSGNLDPLSRIMRPFSLRYFEAVANMEATLRTGITSVREAGGSDMGVKTAVARGMVRGRACKSRLSCSARPAGTVTRTCLRGVASSGITSSLGTLRAW